MMQQTPPPPPGFYPIGAAPPPPPPGFAPVAAAPAPQRQPAPARPAAPGMAPAPAMAATPPLLTVEEMAAANMASGYDPAKAWELAQEDFANQSEGGDPGMAPAQPALPGAAASTGFELPAGVVDWNTLTDQEREGLKRGARVLMPQNEGETFRQIVTLAGDAGGPQRRMLPGDREEMYGGVRGVVPGVADVIGGVASGAAEQVPLLDEAVTGLDALVNRRSFSESRDQYRNTVEALNDQQRGARNFGGVLGAAGMMVAPGVGQAGGFIRAGGTGLAQTARAATVGGGAGAMFGFANSDGGLADRLESGMLGAGVGAATGGLLDAGGQSLIGAAQRRFAAGPSPARQLSRQGVDLTPGQAAGGVLRRVEDGLTSVPILGDAIRGAQLRGLGTFDNVATNTALEPIGVNLADTAGRAGVRAADDAISAAYTRALTGTTFDLDAPSQAALTQARRPDRITADMRRNLNAILDSTLEPLSAGPVTGAVWKEVDSQLAASIRAADRAAANAPEQRILRDRLQEARDAVGAAMERADPVAFADVRAADRASAQYRLVRRASSDVASAGRGGDASPATLNRAVVAAGGERQAARGESLLQDLTDDAMQVLPSTVPDSGTAFRGLLSLAGLGGGATAIGADPLLVGGSIGLLGLGSTVYGPTGQRIFNAIYRSTDRQAANSALGELARLASQNPALQGQYEAAARHLRESFGSPSLMPAPAAAAQPLPTSR